jgi:succinate dehydrogenase / fumarate reductase, iron-sulfur subunit
MADNKIQLHVKRQATPDSQGYWEQFEVPYKKSLNVITLLMEIQRNPLNSAGEKVAPVTWDQNCLEEVCGSCTMNVNGKARQACTTLVDQLEQPIRLEPMKKFPCVRDLQVDRSRMFETLKTVKAWIPIDGSHDLGAGPRVAPKVGEKAYVMSTCMTCGVCLEVCPQYGEENAFVGAFAINQVRLFNSHPTGALNADERLHALMGDGGIADCGNAQNCVKACPKEIPLTESIAAMGRATTVQALKDILG